MSPTAMEVMDAGHDANILNILDISNCTAVVYCCMWGHMLTHRLHGKLL